MNAKTGFCDQCGAPTSVKGHRNNRFCASCEPGVIAELERDALYDGLIKSGGVWVQQRLDEEHKNFNKSVLGYVIGAAAYSVILVLPILMFLDILIGGLTATSDWVISPMAIPLCLIAVLTTWTLCDLHFKNLMEVRLHEIARMKRDAWMISYDLDKLGIDVDNLLAQK
jgi:hypothetical protein